MTESIIRSYLKQELGTDAVYTETPKHMPDEFVTFTLIDRERVNHIDTVSYRFNSYAKSKGKAALLDEKVRAAMDDIIRMDAFSSSKLGGGDDLPDETLDRYRYRCYYNLVY